MVYRWRDGYDFDRIDGNVTSEDRELISKVHSLIKGFIGCGNCIMYKVYYILYCIGISYTRVNRYCIYCILYTRVLYTRVLFTFQLSTDHTHHAPPCDLIDLYKPIFPGIQQTSDGAGTRRQHTDGSESATTAAYPPTVHARGRYGYQSDWSKPCGHDGRIVQSSQ